MTGGRFPNIRHRYCAAKPTAAQHRCVHDQSPCKPAVIGNPSSERCPTVRSKRRRADRSYHTHRLPESRRATTGIAETPSMAADHDAERAVARSQASARQPWSLSPAALRRAPAPRRLVLPSPNGSAISAAVTAAPVAAACLRNAAPVAQWIRAQGWGTLDRPRDEPIAHEGTQCYSIFLLIPPIIACS